MAKGAIRLKKLIEISNVEIHEYCILNLTSGKTTFYKEKKKMSGFTGLYYRKGIRMLGNQIAAQNTQIIALYPTENGPTFYFERLCPAKQNPQPKSDN